MTVLDRPHVTVVGAGIIGLWQAFELSRRGFPVTMREGVSATSTGGASRFAGAMLAPFCEAESAPAIVRSLGQRGLALWKAHYWGTVARGTLVVAAKRDQNELARFARMTERHTSLGMAEISVLEPELAARFDRALFFPDEGHLAPRAAIGFLTAALQDMGAELRFNDPVPPPVWMAGEAGSVVVDCRGIAARDDLQDLRGVRGEMAVVRAPAVKLSRPVRLLHPRFPLYIVPWGESRYMLGATMIEALDASPVSVRSALHLIGAACAVHEGFDNAELLELASGIRPAFPGNVPLIVARGRRLMVNGAYRHGYLLAPALAELIAEYLEQGRVHPAIFREALSPRRDASIEVR
ncbi:MAG TPA: FAD-dependent oxidoreductase [Hyphomicrobiales bacterium]|jgi:glycine oxidase